ncbi:sugar phosphate isomerase/epimerase family protein [Paenibacillus spongiae]|uniref:Sugar phosphate isomerase/epimerase n=1 Tax=Paenibacillus spongiae TaxID=2909671 RepID=A0ABY5SHH8_9BACL|nr:sugar phosphate isomerase/epimerase family protein [Paenibacillus spongiae]UVI33452.1 sugar phosphate isomerase/epimerase [Paenibacillus spongiae]
MELGIFAKTFSRNSVDEVLAAINEYGLRRTQFNMSCAGLPSMPEYIDLEFVRSIGIACKQFNIVMSAVSGTFNMAHPDENKRKQGIDRLRVLAQASSSLGTSVITLCTGSRDCENMWRLHPDNRSKEAWDDMMHTMSAAVEIAEEYKIVLGVEPELANIVFDAKRAKDLLDEIRSPNVRIVMDAANLYNPEHPGPMNDLLSESFDLLGEHIVIAHAKDIIIDGQTEFVAAGQGIVDYKHYLHLLSEANYSGPLILHGLSEEQVNESLSYIQSLMPSVENGSYLEPNDIK